MKRLIIVYNPRSSQYKRVEAEVLAPARQLKGWQLGKYEVKDTNVDDNAAKLAKILMEGDLVVAAGGDGTATIAMNGCMLAKVKTRLAVLPFGNFNDMAAALELKTLDEVLMGKTVESWPLEVLVDGKSWRYAYCYVTMGLFAESVVIFDDKKTRENLRAGKRGAFYSWLWLAKWYLKNRKSRDFLPGLELNGKAMRAGTTDYVASNAAQMAGMMRGKKFNLEAERFNSTTARLTGVHGLVSFMMRSIFYRVPGKETRGDVLKFTEGAEVMVQAEGEYVRLKTRKIEVRKAKRSLMVVTK